MVFVPLPCLSVAWWLHARWMIRETVEKERETSPKIMVTTKYISQYWKNDNHSAVITRGNGKSPINSMKDYKWMCQIGKPSINGGLSIATLESDRVSSMLWPSCHIPPTTFPHSFCRGRHTHHCGSLRIRPKLGKTCRLRPRAIESGQWPIISGVYPAKLPE